MPFCWCRAEKRGVGEIPFRVSLPSPLPGCELPARTSPLWASASPSVKWGTESVSSGAGHAGEWPRQARFILFSPEGSSRAEFQE